MDSGGELNKSGPTDSNALGLKLFIPKLVLKVIGLVLILKIFVAFAE